MTEDIVVIEQKDFAAHPLLSRLLELNNIPKQLYIKGVLPEVTIDEYGRATPRILTIVGSRKNTEYAKSVIKKLISSLSSSPVIVLSGLAYGIDGLAHSLALTHKITTISVPGSGLSNKVLYPSTHRNLAEDIIASSGCLISELEPGTQAAPWTFPARNRIMAALSDAVLIIEAEEKSGTLITARQALELGRDIGAVPGDIFSPFSKGPHMLIKEGAYPITCADDLFSLLHFPNDIVTATPTIYTENEMSLLNLLSEPMERDLLLIKSKLSPEVFLAVLTTLEMNGAIEELFGEVRKIV